MKKRTILFSVLLMFSLVGISCTTPERDTFATLHGTVSEYETQVFLEGVTVMLLPGSKTLITGSDGYFEFADLEPTQYTINVQKSGYISNRKIVTAIMGASTEVNITMTKNSN